MCRGKTSKKTRMTIANEFIHFKRYTSEDPFSSLWSYLAQSKSSKAKQKKTCPSLYPRKFWWFPLIFKQMKKHRLHNIRLKHHRFISWHTKTHKDTYTYTESMRPRASQNSRKNQSPNQSQSNTNSSWSTFPLLNRWFYCTQKHIHIHYRLRSVFPEASKRW